MSRVIEYSANFSSDTLDELLRRVVAATNGFVSDFHHGKVIEFVGSLELEETKPISFAIRPNGQTASLGLSIFMDDIDAPDVSFFGPPDILPSSDRSMASCATSWGSDPMTGNDTVAELFSQVRGYTLMFLERAPDTLLLWTPPGLRNHLVWRTGHAVWAIDRLAIQLLIGASELPDGWEALFGEASVPSPENTWPSRAELRSALERQRDRFLEVIAATDPARLSQHVDGMSDRRTLGGWILHAIHDEAFHGGETYLSKKMHAAQSGNATM